MASVYQSANEQMVQLITEQTIDLIASIKNNISQAKSLTEDDRKNCEAICQQASTEFNRLNMQFLQETLILIDQALNTSDQQIFKQIHHAWSLQHDHLTRQCERIASPLLAMMKILSRNHRSLRKKFRCYLAGSAVSTLLAGTAIGFLIAHVLPICTLILPVGAVAFVSLSALATIAIAIACFTGVINVNTIRKINQKCSDTIQLIITKNLEKVPNGSVKISSLSELTLVIENNISTLKMTEDMWHQRVVLESFKRSVEIELKHLQDTS